MTHPHKHYHLDWDFPADRMVVFCGAEEVAQLPYKNLTPGEKFYWNERVTPMMCYKLLTGGHSLNDNDETRGLIAELNQKYPYVN